MPTIFRQNGFRFFFYSNDGNEPAHIHVERRDGEMKIWLTPIQIERVHGLSARDQREALKITEENVNLFSQ